MIVCSCKAVCDKRLRQVIAAGATTVEEVGRACGAGTGCGSCRDLIQDVLDADARSEQPVPILHLIRREAA